MRVVGVEMKWEGREMGWGNGVSWTMRCVESVRKEQEELDKRHILYRIGASHLLLRMNPGARLRKSVPRTTSAAGWLTVLRTPLRRAVFR
ncbi:MAG: hypothetical protein DVB22_002161 [Verrucomicrobia bacterium]|jgi:hypothetical protein|nr:MAG: hypothetical protein DVB22_002161 [Verrucomicrobiota bacterium]